MTIHYLMRSMAGLALSMALLLSPAMAEEPAHQDPLEADPALTLQEALQLTFNRNPQQFLLQAQGLGLSAHRLSAGSLLPKAPAFALGHQNDALASGRGEREWQADVEIPLWRPGQKAARRLVAEHAEEDLQASRARLLLEVAGQLRDSVWELKMAENRLELARRRHETAQALQQDVERRQQAGELARTDVMLAQQETLQAQSDLVRADAEVNHARHRYTMLTGLTRIPVRLEEAQSPLATFSETHPYWQEAEARVKLAEQKRNLAAVEGRDNLQLVVNARSQRGAFDNAYNDSVGFSIRIPLSSESHVAPLVAAADMEVAQAVAERERLRYQLETAMHEAEHNLTTTRSELRIAVENEAIARESLRLAEKAFQLGEIDLVVLLRARAQAIGSARALSEREIQLQWDIARYNQAVGVLP